MAPAARQSFWRQRRISTRSSCTTSACNRPLETQGVIGRPHDAVRRAFSIIRFSAPRPDRSQLRPPGGAERGYRCGQCDDDRHQREGQKSIGFTPEEHRREQPAQRRRQDEASHHARGRSRDRILAIQSSRESTSLAIRPSCSAKCRTGVVLERLVVPVVGVPISPGCPEVNWRETEVEKSGRNHQIDL